MSKKAVAGILPTERSPKARVLLVSASDGSHKVQWANHGLERRNAMSPTRISVDAELCARAARGYVGPSKASTKTFLFVALIATAASIGASLAAQTSNASGKGVAKPFRGSRSPAETKSRQITPVQPGRGSTARAITKPSRTRVPSGTTATTRRPATGPNMGSATLNVTPRTNNPLAPLMPNKTTSGSGTRAGSGPLHNTGRVSGTGMGPRGTAPAIIRPGAKFNTGVNGTGVRRKN